MTSRPGGPNCPRRRPLSGGRVLGPVRLGDAGGSGNGPTVRTPGNAVRAGRRAAARVPSRIVRRVGLSNAAGRMAAAQRGGPPTDLPDPVSPGPRHPAAPATALADL